MSEPIGLWMYCIVENHGKMAWDCLGIHGTRPVSVVADGGFAAVVSQEPMKRYPLVREFLIAHQRVNETVMQTHQVLPVRFCTIAENEERIIQEVLVPKASELRATLSEITGKEEFGVRARWRGPDQIFGEIGETDERIRQKKEWILSLPEPQRRNELIDIGHLVQEAIQRKNAAMAQSLVEALLPYATEAKRNNTVGDAMVLNAAFLVERARQREFDMAVESLGARYGELLQFKYVGPTPPFNFVEIVIEWKEWPAKTEEQPQHVSAR